MTSCVVVLFAISHSYPREKPVNSDFFVTWPDEHVTLTHLSILEQRSLLPSLPSRTALMQPAANYGHCWSTPSHSPTQHEPFSSSLGCFLNLDTIQRHLVHFGDSAVLSSIRMRSLPSRHVMVISVDLSSIATAGHKNDGTPSPRRNVGQSADEVFGSMRHRPCSSRGHLSASIDRLSCVKESRTIVSEFSTLAARLTFCHFLVLTMILLRKYH